MTPAPDPGPPTAVQAALRAAGRDLRAALAESGYRFTASAALGQVIAGTPDAALGIITAMPLDQQRQLAEHAFTLYELAVDQTPEAQAAHADHQAETPIDAAGLAASNAFLHAWHGRRDRVAEVLDRTDAAHLLHLRHTARTLLADVEARMPQAGPS